MHEERDTLEVHRCCQRFLFLTGLDVPVVRPKVAELAFKVYGRALHPELFEVLQTRKIERNGFEAKVDITSAGHVVTWWYEGQTLTEVATAANHPLPEKRRLMSHRLSGGLDDSCSCRGGAKYEVSFSWNRPIRKSSGHSNNNWCKMTSERECFTPLMPADACPWAPSATSTLRHVRSRY